MKNVPSPVILNLFEDPYCRTGVRDMAWMLKQVQHDKILLLTSCFLTLIQLLKSIQAKSLQNTKYASATCSISMRVIPAYAGIQSV